LIHAFHGKPASPSRHHSIGTN